MKKSSKFSLFLHAAIKLTKINQTKIGNKCLVTMRASSPTEKERPVSQPGD